MDENPMPEPALDTSTHCCGPLELGENGLACKWCGLAHVKPTKSKRCESVLPGGKRKRQVVLCDLGELNIKVARWSCACGATTIERGDNRPDVVQSIYDGDTVWALCAKCGTELGVRKPAIITNQHRVAP